jgi:hypothetical protein
MKLILMSLLLAASLCSAIASNALAGEREDNLVLYAMSGNMDRMRALLDQGRGRKRKKSGANDLTALTEAILFGRADLVPFLLGRGADVNGIGNGFTTLGTATSLGRVNIVRLLIDKGTDVNKKDDESRTALTIANERIEKGNETGFDKHFHVVYTPLTPAEKDEFEEIVRMLRAAGAN